MVSSDKFRLGGIIWCNETFCEFVVRSALLPDRGGGNMCAVCKIGLALVVNKVYHWAANVIFHK